MPVCQASESCSKISPAARSASGRLYLALPLAGVRANLCAGLTEARIDYQTHDGDLVSFDVSPEVLARFKRQVRRRLSAAEMQDARSMLVENGGEPQLADLLHTNSLEQLISQIEGEWLAGILAEGRLATYFQPIVDCNDPAHVLGYECLLRGVQPSGELIYPDRLYDTARQARMLDRLDLAARLKAIDSAARERIAGLVFVNFDPAAMAEPAFSLHREIAAVEASRMPRERFVFEVVESERADERQLQTIFDCYRDAGFRVALDDVGAGYGSLNLLARLKPDFVKLDMELIRDADHDSLKAQFGGRLLELARELGIPSIAEGVETEAEWIWLRDHGADNAQGYFFGRPTQNAGRPLVAAALVE